MYISPLDPISGYTFIPNHDETESWEHSRFSEAAVDFSPKMERGTNLLTGLALRAATTRYWIAFRHPVGWKSIAMMRIRGIAAKQRLGFVTGGCRENRTYLTRYVNNDGPLLVVWSTWSVLKRSVATKYCHFLQQYGTNSCMNLVRQNIPKTTKNIKLVPRIETTILKKKHFPLSLYAAFVNPLLELFTRPTGIRCVKMARHE